MRPLKKFTMYQLAAVAAASIVLTAWICRAVPILPEEVKLSNEILSLADLNRLHVELTVMPDTPQDKNLPTGAMVERVEDALEQRGIEVTNAERAEATLQINLLLFTNADQPEMICAAFHLSLEQSVELKRIGKQSVVPTYALVHGMLTTRKTMRHDLNVLLEAIVNFFARRVQAANTTKDR